MCEISSANRSLNELQSDKSRGSIPAAVVQGGQMLIHGMRLLPLLGKQLVDSRFGLLLDLMINQK